jgi:hypothetical protein
VDGLEGPCQRTATRASNARKSFLSDRSSVPSV